MPVLSSRRSLIQSIAAAAISPELTRAAPSRMFVSLNSSLTGTRTAADGRTAPAVEWPEFARLAARTGYGGADVNLNAAMKQGSDATRALFTELKIRPGVMSFPVVFARDDAAFQSGLTQLDDAG